MRVFVFGPRFGRSYKESAGFGDTVECASKQRRRMPCLTGSFDCATNEILWRTRNVGLELEREGDGAWYVCFRSWELRPGKRETRFAELSGEDSWSMQMP